jgi:DNA-binding SARP family transcriptional activator/Tfp pilus assembly protein PilF
VSEFGVLEPIQSGVMGPIQFGVLGPIRAATGEAVAALPAKERIVLATLLLRAGQVVATSALIGALWDDDPPATARNSVQGHVKQLRRLLGPAGERVITRAPGYLIEVRPGELDLDSFIRLTASAGSAAKGGAWEDTAALLNQALGLWRGEPLSDVPSPLLQRNEAPRLAELRAQALDARVEADLRTGRHDAVTAELRQLVAAHPHRERNWAQLMLALYRGGRPGEALAAYQEARRALRADLGVDPGRQLQDLHRRILAADPVLTDGDPAAGRHAAAPGHPGPGTAPEPRQLPGDLPDFTGRDAEVMRLTEFLTGPTGQPGAVGLTVIAGQGGIGKTALAVHVAHQVAAGFAGGQLFVNLGGAASPLPATEALARFLRDLGVPDTAIPPTEAERAARYRTLLADRKMLVVLDDAHSSAQVRPLLPGGGGAAVIVTSRTMLADLAGAAFCGLSVLDAGASQALLTTIVGRQRLSAEPESTRSVLAACAGLPLAIRIAGSRLASRPRWSVARLSDLLACQHRRLAELTAGDLAVRASIEVSYQALPRGGRMFRLFGLAGLAGLSLAGLAALAAVPEDEANAAVEALVDAHLLESPAPGQFTMHDLVLLYATERAKADEADEEQRIALRRLLTWYLHSLHAAVAALGKLRRPFPLEALPARVRPADFADVAAALAWLQGERANLIKAVDLAAALGLDVICAQLARLLRGFCEWSGYWTDVLTVSVPGLAAARACGDESATAGLLGNLGAAYLKLGRTAQAADCLRRSLDISRKLGDKLGEAMALANLGLLELGSGQAESAIRRFTDALAINIELGDETGQGNCLHNLGAAHRKAGDPSSALDHYQRAGQIRAGQGVLHDEAATLHSIGQLLIELGRVAEGMGYLEEALVISTSNGMRYGEGMTLASLGDGLLALGQPDRAQDVWQRAHSLLVSLGASEAPSVLAKITAFDPVRKDTAEHRP